MESNTFNFYLPWRKTISLVFIVLWSQVFWFISELTALLMIGVLVNIALPLIGVWYISVTSITNKGISLYRVNKLVWSDIVDAQMYKVFGLPYVRIKRQKGMSWAFPLYFVGKKSVKEALINYAPKNNSLYKTTSAL